MAISEVERCACCGDVPEHGRTLCTPCIEAGCHPIEHCRRPLADPEPEYVALSTRQA